MRIPPLKMSSYKLNIKSTPDIGNIAITLTEVFTSNLNKKGSPCSKYERSDFNTCSKKYFSTEFDKTINCTIPGKSSYFKTSFMNYVSCFCRFLIILWNGFYVF